MDISRAGGKLNSVCHAVNSLFCRRFEKSYAQLLLVEMVMDIQSYLVKNRDWVRGLWNKGFEGAQKAAAGLN